MIQNKHPSIFPLLWVMLFDHTCLNITFPILTLLFFDPQSSLFTQDASHAVRSMWYGWCVAVPHLVNVGMTPLLSALSDEFGRKKILMISTLGALLFSITAALGILWGMLSLLFLGRIIQGAFSRTNPIAQAVIGDISPREKKVLHMGYLQTAISTGAFIGPLLGGYVANQFLFKELNFSLPYFLAAVFGGISFLLTIFMFKETLEVKRASARWQAFNFVVIKKVFSNRLVLKISAVLLLSQISWSLYYQFVPPMLKIIFHFDAHQLGWFVGLVACWLALATGFGIKILDRFFSLQQMLIFSLYLMVLGALLTLLCSFLQLAMWVWIAPVPMAVGDVIAFSCLITQYSNVVEKHEQGKVMGVCMIVVALMWALTGVLGGYLLALHTLMPLIVAPVGAVLALVFLHKKYLPA